MSSLFMLRMKKLRLVKPSEFNPSGLYGLCATENLPYKINKKRRVRSLLYRFVLMPLALVALVALVLTLNGCETMPQGKPMLPELPKSITDPGPPFPMPPHPKVVKPASS